MGSITLDDRDEEILERLREGDADVESLAAEIDCSADYLRTRLPELADNGLVRRTDDAYTLTDDGRRVLAGSPAGTADDRIDTSQAVEARLDSFDLRPDREDAVRGAFAFLDYWGEATAAEIVDGVYSEHPAGFESGRQWWEELVRNHLRELPSVESPGSDGRHWRYAGTPVVEKHTADGRVAPDDLPPEQSSAKFALARLPLETDERAAVEAAFEHVFRAGRATDAEIRDQVYPDYDAGYESASKWWADCVRPAFEELPGVEHSDAETWQFEQSVESATGPKAHEELLEPPADEDE